VRGRRATRAFLVALAFSATDPKERTALEELGTDFTQAPPPLSSPSTAYGPVRPRTRNRGGGGGATSCWLGWDAIFLAGVKSAPLTYWLANFDQIGSRIILRGFFSSYAPPFHPLCVHWVPFCPPCPPPCSTQFHSSFPVAPALFGGNTFGGGGKHLTGQNGAPKFAVLCEVPSGGRLPGPLATGTPSWPRGASGRWWTPLRSSPPPPLTPSSQAFRGPPPPSGLPHSPQMGPSTPSPQKGPLYAAILSLNWRRGC